ncbi:anoctamin-5-like isoform X2 [Styela clava]
MDDNNGNLSGHISHTEVTYAGTKRKRKKRTIKSIVKSSKVDAYNIQMHPDSTSKTEDSGKMESDKTHEREEELPKAVYLQPTPRTLPPIDIKTSVGTSSVVATSAAFPDIQKTTRPTNPVLLPPINQDNKKGVDNASYTKHAEKSDSDTQNLNNGINENQPLNEDTKKKKYYQKPRATLYFKDNERRIDFVLAYDDDEQDSEKKTKRDKFENGLMETGLQLEWEPKEESQDQKTCFVKIHAPWSVLLKYAEIMRIKMPLKEDESCESREKLEEEHENADICCHSVWSKCKCCFDPCRLDSGFIEDEGNYYTAEFSKEKQSFFDIKDRKTFFSNSERSRITYRILSETRFAPGKLQLGIQRLINQSVYDSAFPLHEGKHTAKDSKLPVNSNMRRMLYWEWARWGRWYKFQPLDAVRKYFGDSIGIYFTWLGFYTHMLVYPSILGIIVFCYSAATLSGDPNSREICDDTYPTYVGNETMCPVCDVDCSYWKLTTSCLAARFTHLFDNNSTIFFAVFMSLWATMFLEFWKREQFRLSYEWDLVDYDEEQDLIRPEFEAVVKKERLNPVTQQKEPYLDARTKYSRVAFSLVTVIFWLLVIVAAVFAIIVYRLAIKAIFAVSIDFTQVQDVELIGQFATPQMLTTITASLLSLIVIMVLNKVYEVVALKLTHMELPRTQMEFDDSFTFKMFCFQFVNYYSYLFYVAFFKTSIAGNPSNYTYLGDWRWEQCDPGGCMYELSIQLIIIMLGKQLWNNTLEIVLPWTLNKYRQYKSTKRSKEMPDNEYTRWEQDYDLQQATEMGLFYEYLEMIIQFGFVTLFVAAFPLAPLLALLNNIIEIRLDANKFICELRRPLAQKCADIGAWYHLLEFIATISVVTNSFTIAITSEAIPKMVYYYEYSIEPYGSYTERTLQGYTNDSLSLFNTSDFSERSMPKNPDPFGTGNVTICRYRDYRTPPSSDPKYALTMQYWHVVAARLAFVIVMEHVVFLLKRFLDYIIPDRPKKLRDLIKREHFLVKEMLVKAEAEHLWKQGVKTENEMAGRKEKPTGNTRTVQPMMSSTFDNFSIADHVSSSTPL